MHHNNCQYSEYKICAATGDICVVALTDQWYITYGEDEWANITKECLQQLNCYATEAKNNFDHVLGEFGSPNIICCIVWN